MTSSTLILVTFSPCMSIGGYWPLHEIMFYVVLPSLTVVKPFTQALMWFSVIHGILMTFREQFV